MSRRSLADTIDALDEQIKQLQESKRDTFGSYREQLEEAGMTKPAIRAEVSTLKLAIRRRRELQDDPEAVREREGLFDEILDEITRDPPHARGARAHAREDAEAEH